jgi:hypothetical protein
MNRFEPGTPRAFVGFAAVCMAAATLAVSVIAPAAIDSTSREVGVATMSSEPRNQGNANPGALTTSIDVVGVRTTRRVPVGQTRAQVGTVLQS